MYSRNERCDENHPQVLAWVLPQCDEGCHGGSAPSPRGTQNPRMEIVLVVPQDVVAQALLKPNGGVRGIVVGDIVRRLVARTIAQQMSDVVEAATAPHQYALSTRAGTECIAHALQLLTEENPRGTVLSIDGIGAFDLISRKSMLEALMRVEGGPAIMPFVRMFYGQPSSYFWEGDDGTVYHIEQGEGGEQGDPLMPLLFALGQHTALCGIDNSLGADDHLMAFLDDVYFVTFPESLRDGCGSVQQELWTHSRIRIHEGKTQVWNSGGERPEFSDVLERVAQVTDPEARVWRGSGMPTSEQGIRRGRRPFGPAGLTASPCSSRGIPPWRRASWLRCTTWKAQSRHDLQPLLPINWQEWKVLKCRRGKRCLTVSALTNLKTTSQVT